METSCLRLRFTPLFKNICKNDSKCCLEIVPEVSCIQNLDKIQWQQGDNSIEYTIPITYKVILKKNEVCKLNNVGSLKTYHSCVDLLLPSSSCYDIGYGDITKIMSDTVILSKHTDNIQSTVVEQNDTKKLTENFEEVQTTEPNPTETSCTRQISCRKQSKGRELKHENSQILQLLDNNYGNLIKKIYLIDKVTSTTFSGDFRNQHTSADMLSCTGTFDFSSTAGKVDHKLSITPIYSLNTDDENPSDQMNGGTSNLIVLRIQEPIYNTNLSLCDKDFKTLKVPKKRRFEVKSIKDNSLETLTKNSSERVLPEVRVAQFMKTVEKELSPLKNKLNDMILRCSLLGFICRDNQNPMYSSLPKSKKEMSWCKKESKSNRVVYSIVFDG